MNNKFEIRKAKSTDNLKELGEFFYFTDPYIFPYMFENKNKACAILGNLLAKDEGAFSYKNCLVATKGSEIIGVVLYLTKDTNYDYDYSKLKTQNAKYKYTIENYIEHLPEYITENEVYVAMVYVKPKCRERHVATRMLNNLFQMFQNSVFKLHVLQTNNIAIGLYIKEGFKIKEGLKGFNGYRLRKPDVYEMIKD